MSIATQIKKEKSPVGTTCVSRWSG